MRGSLRSIAIAAGLAIIAGGAAADVQTKQFKVVGTFGNLTNWQKLEKPFWEETLPKASGGKLTAQAQSQTELGLKGFEIMRLLKQGIFDVAHALPIYVAEDAVLEGVGLAGVARDFAGSARAAAGGSCVDCHMATVERSFALTPAEDGGAGVAAPVRQGRSHALQTPRDPAFLRRAFGWTAQRSEGRSLLKLRNLAGHRVPGLIGREILLDIELMDAAGVMLARRELRFDAEEPLATDEVRAVEFDGDGARLRVRGRHVDPRLARPVEFLELELALD